MQHQTARERANALVLRPAKRRNKNQNHTTSIDIIGNKGIDKTDCGGGRCSKSCIWLHSQINNRWRFVCVVPRDIRNCGRRLAVCNTIHHELLMFMFRVCSGKSAVLLGIWGVLSGFVWKVFMRELGPYDGNV